MALTHEQWSEKYGALAELFQKTIRRSWEDPNWAIKEVENLKTQDAMVRKFKEENNCRDLSYTRGPDGNFYMIEAK
jgi:hypothetical protein